MLHNVAIDYSGKYHWVYSSQDESLLLRNIIMGIHARDEELNEMSSKSFFSSLLFRVMLNLNASKKSYWNKFLSFPQAVNEPGCLCSVHIYHQLFFPYLVLLSQLQVLNYIK